MKKGIGLFSLMVILFIVAFIVIPRLSNMSAEQQQSWRDWAYSQEACERDSPIKRGELVQLANGAKFIMVEACFSDKKAWVLDSSGKDAFLPKDLLTKIEIQVQ